jgi:hypothetical protein
MKIEAVRYFRGHTPDDADLMGFEVDEDFFGGRPSDLARASRDALGSRVSVEVMDMLNVADEILQSWINRGWPVRLNGEDEPTQLTTEHLRGICPTEFLGAIATAFSRDQVLLQTTDTGQLHPITPESLCAAFCLAQLFESLKHQHIDWTSLNGGYHAMLAAEAHAIGLALGGSRSDAFGRILAAKSGREGALKRSQTDPKRAAMKAIHDEWLATKQKGEKFSATAFARGMAKKHSEVTVEAIKNAQTRWSKHYPPRG